MLTHPNFDVSNIKKMSIVFGQVNRQFNYVIGENVRHRFPMHIHHTFCVGMVTKGKRLIQFPHGNESIGEGEIFVINAGQPHAVRADEPHDYIAVNIDQIFPEYSFRNKIRSLSCQALFANISDTIRNGKQDLLSSFITNISEALEEFKTITSINQSPVKMVQKAKEYMDSHYHEPILIADIARHLCISPFHFCRLFKQYTGISPYSYLLQYRIKCSRSLLQNHYSVFDAAVASGFYDSSHYIRHFISYEGISPRHYQKNFS